MSLVAVVVLAAGCGGDDDDEESSSTTAPAVTGTTSPATTSTPAADSRTPEQFAADRAAADMAVLKLSDFPPGWTSESSTDDTSPELEAARDRLADCLGVDRSFLGRGGRAAAKAESDDFEDDDNNQVQNTVTLVASRERALAQLAPFRRPQARDCVETFVNTAIEQSVTNPRPGRTAPPGLSFGRARVEALDVPGLHTESVAYRSRVPVTVQGETRDVLLDILLALKGRAGITMIFISIGQTFPAELATSLTNAVIDRAPAS